MSKINFYFPWLTLLFCFISVLIDEGADQFAYKRGLFVIEQSGETVNITNDDELSPMEW